MINLSAAIIAQNLETLPADVRAEICNQAHRHKVDLATLDRLSARCWIFGSNRAAHIIVRAVERDAETVEIMTHNGPAPFSPVWQDPGFWVECFPSLTAENGATLDSVFIRGAVV